MCTAELSKVTAAWGLLSVMTDKGLEAGAVPSCHAEV